MFEPVIEKVPELARLEKAISALEAEHGRAQSRVQGLADRVAEAREADLTNAALALNRGHKVPPAKEPAVREQLEEATRELEILERRLALAQAERSRFVQENGGELARLLSEAQEAAGRKVAAGASEVLGDLLTLYKCEDDARALARLSPEPVPENDGPPQRSTTVFGPLTMANTAGPRRGDLESTLRYLMSLGPAVEIGEQVDEDEEGAA